MRRDLMDKCIDEAAELMHKALIENMSNVFDNKIMPEEYYNVLSNSIGIVYLTHLKIIGDSFEEFNMSEKEGQQVIDSIFSQLMEILVEADDYGKFTPTQIKRLRMMKAQLDIKTAMNKSARTTH